MKNDHGHDDDGNTPNNLYSRSARDQRGGKRRKTNEKSNQSTDMHENSWQWSWQHGSPLRKLEIILLTLTAVGGIGYLSASVTLSIWRNTWSRSIAELGHAPLIINSRPPELLRPFVCDQERHTLSMGNMQLFVKNVGNARAINVNPYISTTKLVPEKRTGNAFLNDLPYVNCDAEPKVPDTTINLAPGQELIPQKDQTAVSFVAFPDQTVFQLYFVSCIYYSDDHGSDHATCDTYRLDLSTDNPLGALSGSPSFFCDQKPRIGRFVEAVRGHCRK